MTKTRILVPLDFSAQAERVLLEARVLAEATGRELDLLHVAAPNPEFVGYQAGPQSVRDSRAEILREERVQLQDLAKELTEAGLPARARVLEGATVKTILEQSSGPEVRMIVMGTHGRTGLASLLMGSVCEGVLKGALCPVLVVPLKDRSGG